MNARTEVWGLWDADELVSVHLTGQDARDARERHLHRYREFLVEQDVIVAAVEVRRTHLIDPGSTDDPVPVWAKPTHHGGVRW